MQSAMKDPEFIKAASQLVVALCSDPQVLEASTKLASNLQNEPLVYEATSKLMIDSSHEVMNNPEILDHTKDFVSDVITDSSIQRTSGAFLYNTMLYTFVPSAITLIISLGVGFVGVGAIAAVRGGYVGGDKSIDDLLDKIANDSYKIVNVTTTFTRDYGGKLLMGSVRYVGLASQKTWEYCREYTFVKSTVGVVGVSGKWLGGVIGKYLWWGGRGGGDGGGGAAGSGGGTGAGGAAGAGGDGPALV
jgi:hypothetical protein